MHRLRITFALVVTSALGAAACGNLGDRALTGKCPSGEVCSDSTPHGLHFDGASLGDETLFVPGPAPTLIGGTQAIRLSYDPGDGRSTLPLDLPYVAGTDGTALEIAARAGHVVTLRGRTSGAAFLRITDDDGALFDRKELAGATLTRIRMVPANFEAVVPGDEIVFAAGTFRAVVALHGTSRGSEVRAVDDSMTINAPGTTRVGWDTIQVTAAAPGTRTVLVRAGDEPEAAVPLEVVAGPDELELQPIDSSLVRGQAEMLCVSARAGAGRHVAGLTWTFSTDNGDLNPLTGLFENCTMITPAAAGTLHFTASAGGQTLVATIPVEVTGPGGGGTRTAPHGTTAGDRARLALDALDDD